MTHVTTQELRHRINRHYVLVIPKGTTVVPRGQHATVQPWPGMSRGDQAALAEVPAVIPLQLTEVTP